MAHDDDTKSGSLNESDQEYVNRGSTNTGGTTVGATGAGGARPGQVMGGTIGPGTQPEDTVDANLEDMEVGPADTSGPGRAGTPLSGTT